MYSVGMVSLSTFIGPRGPDQLIDSKTNLALLYHTYNHLETMQQVMSRVTPPRLLSCQLEYT